MNKQKIDSSIRLVNRVAHLMDEQKALWPLLEQNYLALSNVKTKSFLFESFEIKAQFNPGRIISSSADVTKSAIEKRPCFLCQKNLPDEQIKLKIKNFSILCNPYPIFPEHFTIAKAKHEPQSILENFEELLDISQMLGGKYTILYNGPECGASAPDHMHFQAVTKHIMPIEEQVKDSEIIEKIVLDETTISFINDSLRRYILLSSSERNKLVSVFKWFYQVYGSLKNNGSEPMMNIICMFDGEEWRTIIFLRQTHRPKQYYALDKSKILLSPAVVDLGGLLIFPRENDFKKTQPEDIRDIFRQVVIDADTFKQLIDSYRRTIFQL
jgi:hypothetical protein